MIVKVEHEDLEVTWQGYAILTREQVALLQQGLATGGKIYFPNMPRHWEEEFSVSELEDAFGIVSEDADDVAQMRRLFGEIVGETSLIWQVMELAEEEGSGGDSGNEGGEEVERETPAVIDREVAERFLENPDAIDLWKATSITDDSAAILAKHEDELELSGLTELSDTAAEALAKKKGRLFLTGLTEISDTVAEALAHHEGLLNLDGLAEISDTMAEALAKHEGELVLDGLTELSNTATEALAKKKGYLSLGGLTELSDTAVEVLAKHEGELDLSSLTELSDSAVESLSRHAGFIHLGSIENLTADFASYLTSQAQNPEEEISARFYALKLLSDEAALALARGKFSYLIFDAARDVSPSALLNLKDYEGKLGFGMTEINPEMASSLAQSKAESLELWVTSLDDRTCELLSTFKGELSLACLEEVSQIGAKWLLEQGNVNEYCPVDLEAIASGEEDDDDEEWED